MSLPGLGMLAACPPGRAPGGRDVCIVACEPPEACLGDNFCAEGYASKAPPLGAWRCASCAPGFFKRAGQCIRCPDSPAALVIGFLLLIGGAAALGVLLQRKQVNALLVKIMCKRRSIKSLLCEICERTILICNWNGIS
jgi:hypothetical protein